MGILKSKIDFEISTSTGISEITEVQLGNVPQTILIQGENRTNPILLFLHGGPSMPLPGVSCKGRDYVMTMTMKELIKHFVVVFWDQRGTGKSYSSDIPQETMTVKQFVSDANELTDYLRRRFEKEKLFLAAHSWGTVIGLNLVTQYPDKYHSYVGMSQIVSWVENDKLALKWAKEEAARRGNQKALKQLEDIGEPPFLESFEQWGVLRNWQLRFNSMFYSDKKVKHPGMMGLAKITLQSKEYSLKDVYQTFYKGFKLVYHQAFIEELATFNFEETLSNPAIPVTFIHGKKDVHVNGSLVESYFNGMKAEKGKRLIWLENSSHAFYHDDARIVEQRLIEELIHLN